MFDNDNLKKFGHSLKFDIKSLNKTFGEDTIKFKEMISLNDYLKPQESPKETLGLSRMCKRFFEKYLSKKFQKENWTQRPLTKKM